MQASILLLFCRKQGIITSFFQCLHWSAKTSLTRWEVQPLCFLLISTQTPAHWHPKCPIKWYGSICSIIRKILQTVIHKRCTALAIFLIVHKWGNWRSLEIQNQPIRGYSSSCYLPEEGSLAVPSLVFFSRSPSFFTYHLLPRAWTSLAVSFSSLTLFFLLIPKYQEPGTGHVYYNFVMDHSFQGWGGTCLWVFFKSISCQPDQGTP